MLLFGSIPQSVSFGIPAPCVPLWLEAKTREGRLAR